MKRRSYAVAGAALMTAMTVSACGGDRGPDASQTAGVSATANMISEEPLLNTPLQAYRLTPTEVATIFYARGHLIDRCMKRFGFGYPQEPFADELQRLLESERSSITRLYGLTDATSAVKYGYGFPPTTHSDPSPAESERSDAYLFVLHGSKDLNVPPTDKTTSPGEIDGEPIPPGGCVRDADLELGTEDPDVSVYGLAHTLWIQGNSKLIASDGYRTAIAEWAACLAEDGYHVTDPLNDQGDIKAIYAARAAAGDDALDGEPIPGELELATADVECKAQVQFVKRLDKLTTEIDRKAIERNQTALEEDRSRLDTQVRNATEVLDQVAG